MLDCTTNLSQMVLAVGVSVVNAALLSVTGGTELMAAAAAAEKGSGVEATSVVEESRC